MYVCGPTVYNYIHIGNARSAVAFDTIRRYFEYRGYQVNYVSNFTDVDDKIIKASHEMNLSVPEVTEKFIQAFYADTDALNIKRATKNPRVMENMDEIIAFVDALITKGYAYEADGDAQPAANKRWKKNTEKRRKNQYASYARNYVCKLANLEELTALKN